MQTKTDTEGKGKYGIKAYGKTTRFPTRQQFNDYLIEWMCGTEGAEQERATRAYVNLMGGIPFTDTDAGY